MAGMTKQDLIKRLNKLESAAKHKQVRWHYVWYSEDDPQLVAEWARLKATLDPAIDDVVFIMWDDGSTMPEWPPPAF